MIQKKMTERLGIKYPIIGGAMMSISTPEFVAAVSNAGGMGILASTIYKTPEKFEKALDKILELTDKPFAVNLSLFKAIKSVDNNLYLDIMKTKGVKIVETSGHSAPVELSKRFKQADMTWIHKCVGPRYARKVEGLGADLVTVVGYENGGATGNFDIATMCSSLWSKMPWTSRWWGEAVFPTAGESQRPFVLVPAALLWGPGF